MGFWKRFQVWAERGTLLVALGLLIIGTGLIWGADHDMVWMGVGLVAIGILANVLYLRRLKRKTRR